MNSAVLHNKAVHGLSVNLLTFIWQGGQVSQHMCMIFIEISIITIRTRISTQQSSLDIEKTVSLEYEQKQKQ
uniref:Uncharacterized protein n=1 Tax=Glossina brevipalpis TaxID=37001 RepID=A0A1A9WRK3_9MUSC